MQHNHKPQPPQLLLRADSVSRAPSLPSSVEDAAGYRVGDPAIVRLPAPGLSECHHACNRAAWARATIAIGYRSAAAVQHQGTDLTRRPKVRAGEPAGGGGGAC